MSAADLRAQVEEEKAPPVLVLPAGGDERIRISAGAGSRLEGDDLYLTGYVDIRFGDLRLQADTVRLNRETKDCEAEGNVVIDMPNLRITAATAELNLETGLGVFHQALVQAEPAMILEAERVERIAADRFLMEKGSFTTCTQPTPYWSFHVGRGLIHMDHYAYLHNLSFRVNGVPVLYSPYLVWPIKEDRTTGLLIPEVGYSQRRGVVLNAAFFWAMSRNMDTTFYLDVFGNERVGAGVEYRFVPNPAGRGRFAGYYLEEQKTGSGRWFVGFREDQRFSPRSRLLADVNVVSDSNYYLNFERDLGIGTDPSALSTVINSWNGANHSLNVRMERREQFSTGSNLQQWILPEVEWRGRQRQLGNTPILFAFESSVDYFRKETSTYDTDYGRVDFFPRFSAPWNPAPWLQVEPSLRLRGTYYTRSLPGGALSEEDLERRFLDGRLDVIGPKFARTFGRLPDDGGPRYRNTIEPRVIYQYVTRSTGADDVIRFDEIDTLQRDRNLVNYSLTTRLYAKRPAPGPTGKTTYRTHEVSSLTLSQSLSFDDPLSVSLQLADESSYSPVSLIYRYNPTQNTTVNLTSAYDILFDEISAVSISTTLRSEKRGILDFSWVQQKFLETGSETSQFRLLGEARFLQQRLELGIQASYDAEASQLRDQRYRIGYNTQCCGFAVEWFGREFVGIDEEEIRFTVNLKGVGTVVDFHTGTAVGQPQLY